MLEQTASKNTVNNNDYPHESAHLHVAGEARYVDDIPELAGTLHAALGKSTYAHARIKAMDLAAVMQSPGVVAVLTAHDIPGKNSCGPILDDDLILADDRVQYLGQPLFAVIAESYSAARLAATRAHIEYEPLPVILTAQEARQAESYVIPPMHLHKGDAGDAIKNAPRFLKGELSVGGQEQFYLEGQITYAAPKEDQCLHVWCSTQHPTEMQHLVAHSLQLSSNQVVVEMRRMGGGFGGKESQSAQFACIASIAAHKLQCPVKLRLDRDDDILITGKRHGFHYQYEVGYDDDGLIRGVKLEMVSNAGYSADLSGPVMTRAVCHFDNCYYLNHLDIQAFCGKTHTQSNTAFRGFGGPQGAFAIEYIIDNIARELNLEPLQIQRRNFYGKTENNLTPYGQTVKDNVIHELIDELLESSDYENRKQQIANFNKSSPVIKKGLALTPVKFGISFNVVHFNQAGALVHIYTDGSVLVNHGGTEMGQGLNTKVSQVVANELGIHLDRVRSTATDTSKIPNTSATAASTGSDLNGKAAQDAALKVKRRLAEFAARVYGGTANDVLFQNDQISVNGTEISFAKLVSKAYLNRVQLWSDGFYKTPKLNWNRDTLNGSPFYYFAYGAAVSEVAVDTLTGEWKLLQADLLHDAGNSINPAIDIGQIEGGFIQGMGWLTLEELCWNDKGLLTTHAPSTYKIPAISDCPPRFNTRLYDNDNVEDTIMRSKAVGEPPLLLGFSVFYAIRNAIASIAGHTINPPLNAPATPEAILSAVTATQAASDRGTA